MTVCPACGEPNPARASFCLACGTSLPPPDVAVRGIAEATVLRGRCPSYGEGITFWPVAEVVRQAAGMIDTDPPAEATAKLRRLLADAADADRADGALAAGDARLAAHASVARLRMQVAVATGLDADALQAEARRAIATFADGDDEWCLAEAYGLLAALQALAGLQAMAGEPQAAVATAGRAVAVADDPAAAERHLRWGIRVLERQGESGMRSNLTADLTHVLHVLGRREEALRQARVSRGLAAAVAASAALELYLAKGNLPGAARARVAAATLRTRTASRAAADA
jgi:Double zinc ribbon